MENSKKANGMQKYRLDLEVSTEDVDELIASHSEPMSNGDLITMQEQIRQHMKTKMTTK
jgi:hypothetical protein